MAKEFKTVDELIELMRSRAIQVGGDAASAIRRESYYAIVNGYKGPFIDRAAMRSTSDDAYLEGTTFDQIYALFKFDRDLRCLTFEYLIRAEAVMKNTVAYAFCERFPEHDAYLERSSYAKAKDMLSCLGKVLPTREVEACGAGVRQLIDSHSEKLGARVRAEVLKAMGDLRPGQRIIERVR